ncbi:hypothetical protein [Streptomyces sp. 3214.6]|uniref:hypothetical protein n=1 Tax=Streptomyces sp. 3214.6 TaxID=1882757 RepID=UPI002F915B2F
MSVVHGPWEVRVHRVAAPAGTPVREGGWAVACDDAPPAAQTGEVWAQARRADGLTSALVGLLGWDDATAEVARARGHSAYGEHSAVPLLTTPHPGGTLLLATLVVLSADPLLPADHRAGAHAVPFADGALEIRFFPDGATEAVTPPAGPG